MKKGRIISLIGLIVSILIFTITPCIIYKTAYNAEGEITSTAMVFTLLWMVSFFIGIVSLVLFIVFSINKNSSPKSGSKGTDAPETEERNLKAGIKRTPRSIWVISITCAVLGMFFLIILPPLGFVLIGFGFLAFYLPYYTWKKEHIRAPWPSGKLTPEKITLDILTHKPNSNIEIPFDYRIVEDVVLKTNYSITDDYTPTTITFKNSGTFKIKPSMFQKYYSPVEIAVNIQQGEGVYLIFSNETNKLEFVYRKIYCTL